MTSCDNSDKACANCGACAAAASQQTAFEVAEMEARERTKQLAKNQIEAIMPGLLPLFAHLQAQVYLANYAQGFWASDNTGEKIALMHSELSEALEADRKDLPSDHIEGFTGVEEELADAIIRILDFSGRKGLRLGEAIHAKLLFNLTRPYKHGKKY